LLLGRTFKTVLFPVIGAGQGSFHICEDSASPESRSRKCAIAMGRLDFAFPSYLCACVRACVCACACMCVHVHACVRMSRRLEKAAPSRLDTTKNLVWVRIDSALVAKNVLAE